MNLTLGPGVTALVEFWTSAVITALNQKLAQIPGWKPIESEYNLDIRTLRGNASHTGILTTAFPADWPVGSFIAVLYHFFPSGTWVISHLTLQAQHLGRFGPELSSIGFKLTPLLDTVHVSLRDDEPISTALKKKIAGI